MAETDGPDDPPAPPPPPGDPADSPKLDVIDGGAAKPRNRAGYSITKDIYDRLLELYLRGERTAKGLGRKGGVHYRTARKAIDHGWPEKHWPALKIVAADSDALARKNQAAIVADPARAEEAASWTEIRRQHLKMALQIRALLARLMVRLNEAIEDSTATVMKPRRTIHYEEHLDAEGHVIRRIPRTLTEDVPHKPNLLAVASALSDAAGVLRSTGAHEIGMANSRDPAGMERKPGWSALSEEALAYIKEHGRPPPGVSLDQLEQG